VGRKKVAHYIVIERRAYVLFAAFFALFTGDDGPMELARHPGFLSM
jgi:hypothetical protein